MRNLSTIDEDFTVEERIKVDFPEPFLFLFKPYRYKSARGGRGGAKSWAYADALLIKGVQQKLRILCTRELQTTIADSVHKLLSDEINRLGLQGEYIIQKNTILGKNGTEFIFKGLRFNIEEIKSTEGIDICWVEEAQNVSEESWKILIPTIRKEGSEIWLTWNTGEEKDATYQRFVVNPPPDCISVLVNYDSNPFFPETLERERAYCEKVDPDAYANIWLGQPRFLSDALVFKGKFTIGEFEAPKGVRFRFGADWGFSQDPTALIRNFIVGNNLYIDYEACGVGIEIDDLPELFDSVPEVRRHKIIADSARPETISFIRRQGFNIVPCNKSSKTKKGFVQDGIEFIRKFENIYIHPRCVHVIDEFQHYSYKKDKNGNILPILLDSFNHCFTGDTQIRTDKGDKSIRDVQVGDMVLTRKGFRKVITKFDNGVQPVWTYKFANNKTLISTCTHNIITRRGKKKINRIKSSDELYFLVDKGKKWKIIKSKNVRTSFLMTKWGISAWINPIRLSSGKRKVMGHPTFSKILNLSKKLACIVTKHFTQGKRVLKENFVQKIVAGCGDESKVWIMWRRLASYVERLISRTNISKARHARSSVVQFLQPVTEVELKRVYNLEVEDQHEYFANGILVANCIDALRYSLEDKIKGGTDWLAVMGMAPKG